MLQICSNIRQAREATTKTQREMAKLLGVKRTTYANWENETEPTVTIIKDIAKILGVEAYKLLDIDKPPESELKEEDAVYKKKIEDLELDIKLIKQTVVSLRQALDKDDPPKNGFPPLKTLKPNMPK